VLALDIRTNSRQGQSVAKCGILAAVLFGQQRDILLHSNIVVHISTCCMCIF